MCVTTDKSIYKTVTVTFDGTNTPAPLLVSNLRSVDLLTISHSGGFVAEGFYPVVETKSSLPPSSGIFKYFHRIISHLNQPELPRITHLNSVILPSPTTDIKSWSLETQGTQLGVRVTSSAPKPRL